MAVHALAIWQFVPSYPRLQSVHVHAVVVPPIVPPLMHQNLLLLPSSVETEVGVHTLAVAQLVPSHPRLHDVHVHAPVVPPIVPPLMQ